MTDAAGSDDTESDTEGGDTDGSDTEGSDTEDSDTEGGDTDSPEGDGGSAAGDGGGGVNTLSTGDGGVVVIPTGDGGTPSAEDAGPGPTVAIGGQIRISERVFLDVDVKNTDVLPGSNDVLNVADATEDESQEITSPSTVVGYLGPEAATDDATRADNVDHFKVQLEVGQTVTLVTAEDPNGGEAADLDLYLLDAERADTSDGGTWVDDSMGIGDKEQVTAPATGTYWIAVERYVGDEVDAAKSATYSLSVGIRQSSDTLEELASMTMSTQDEMITGEAVVEMAQSMRLSGVAAAANYGRYQRVKLNLPGARQNSVGRVASTKDDRLATIRAIKKAAKMPGVKSINPVYMYHPSAAPNDPLYDDQWHYDQIDLEEAWENTDRIDGASQGEGVIVAVIDTGVVLAHPDFANADGSSQLVQGKDMISLFEPDGSGIAVDGDGYDDDPNDPGDGRTPGDHSFHGTHCAGTVAAATNNREGGAGVAPKAKIMPIRAMGRGGGISLDIAESIKWAAGLPNASGTVPDQPAHIISMSLGGPRSPVFQDAVDMAREAGVIVIAAAGNENSPVEFVGPAAEEGVVAVSATDFNRDRAFYSNYGSLVDVGAPGGDTQADANLDGLGDGVISMVWKNNGQTRYVAYQGTSMATPHVAGVVALMKSVWPAMTPADFDRVLASGEITVDIGEDGKDSDFGYGLINANKAVLVAAREAGVDDQLAPDPVLSVSTTVLDFGGGDTNMLPLSISNTGDGTLDVTNVTVSGSWLNVAPGEVGVNTVTVDRTDDTLQEGVNTGTILVESNGGNITIDVRVFQGVEPNGGDIDLVYVMLVDPTTGTAMYQEGAFRNEEGFIEDYGFLFEGVETGKYYLVAGSDVQDTRYLGNDGDFYGAFPLAQDPIMLCVNQEPDETGCREFIDTERLESNFNLQVLMDQGAEIEDDSVVDGGVSMANVNGSVRALKIERLW